MNKSNIGTKLAATMVALAQLSFHSQVAEAEEQVTYNLPYEAALIYPAENWLPDPYEKYYEDR